VTGHDLIELVDQGGRSVGTTERLIAHRPPGRLHRAISVFLLNGDGALVVQRRAAGKYHSAGLWSNTCCGHPDPGEAPGDAAARRLVDELDLELDPAELSPAGTVVYQVGDPISGLIECEYNHLFVGRTALPIRPNPEEVADIRAIPLDDLTAPAMSMDGFTAWFPIILDAAMPALLKMGEDLAPP
jgi:isopentenyl-diphosphate delta-isomerase